MGYRAASIYAPALLLLVATGCQHSPYRSETRILSEYLDNKFQVELPSERSYMLVLNGIACSLCIDELTTTFARLRSSKPNLFLITNDVGYLGRLGGGRSDRRQVLFDDTPELSRLDLGSGGSTLFIVEAGEVIDKMEMGPENVHTFADIVK